MTTTSSDVHPAARLLRWFTTGTTTAGLVLAAVPLLAGGVAPGASADVPGAFAPIEPGTGLSLVGDRERLRKIKRYRVRPGDTPSSIAARYHAWTDELIARNGRTLYVGDVIRIPVVRRAQQACERHRHH
nr:LysM peptidoglycan-binding domain-containing protein [Nocardioidaceae bacterium]